MNQHVREIELEFFCLLLFQLIYFFLLHPCFIWHAVSRLLLLLLLLIIHNWLSFWVTGWQIGQLILIINIFVEIVLLFVLILLTIIIFDVFIVSIIVATLRLLGLWLTLRLLLMLLLILITDPEIGSNYLYLRILVINWLFRVHVSHRFFSLFVNYKQNVITINITITCLLRLMLLRICLWYLGIGVAWLRSFFGSPFPITLI